MGGGQVGRQHAGGVVIPMCRVCSLLDLPVGSGTQHLHAALWLL